jgi:hypothetical protein
MPIGKQPAELAFLLKRNNIGELPAFGTLGGMI